MAMRIKYNFRDTYTPATSISNTLAAGSTGLNQSTTAITDKKYIDTTAQIMALTAANTGTITFTRCLFVNCNDIFLSAGYNVGTITFINCTFVNCDYIVQTTGTITGVFNFTKCIISQSRNIDTNQVTTFTDCCYDDFYGVTPVLSGTNIQKNPLFRTTTGTNLYSLMSKSRGDLYNSPCITESGYSADLGCWTETRASAVAANDYFDVDIQPDKYTKRLILTDYQKFYNETGAIVQFHNYGNEKKYVTLNWNQNEMSYTEIANFLLMMKAQSTTVYIYPLSTDTNRYITGIITKTEDIPIERWKQLYADQDNDLYDDVGYSGISITLQIASEVGTWRS